MDTRLSPGLDSSSSEIPFSVSTVAPNTPNYRAYTYNGFNFSLTTGFSPTHPPPMRPPSVDTLQSVSTLVGSPPPLTSDEIRISIGIDIGSLIFNSIKNASAKIFPKTNRYKILQRCKSTIYKRIGDIISSLQAYKCHLIDGGKTRQILNWPGTLSTSSKVSTLH